MTSQDISIIEYDFDFFVFHPFQDFKEIRSTLVSRISHTQNDFTQRENAIFDFVKTKVDENIIKGQNIKYYFLSAREKDGSYELGFILLILFNAAVNYGSIRQSIDYLNKDFSTAFKMLLGEEYTIVSQVNESPIVRKNSNKASEFENIFKRFTPRQIGIALGIWFLLVIAYQMANPDVKPTSVPKTEEYIEQIVDKKINEAIYKKKIDFIIDNFPLIRDTVFVRKNPADTIK